MILKTRCADETVPYGCVKAIVMYVAGVFQGKSHKIEMDGDDLIVNGETMSPSETIRTCVPFLNIQLPRKILHLNIVLHCPSFEIRLLMSLIVSNRLCNDKNQRKNISQNIDQYQKFPETKDN